MFGRMTSCRDVVGVGRRVVNIIEGRHQTKLSAAELSFEDADFRPAMVGFVFRRDSPEVVPFMAHRLGSAHVAVREGGDRSESGQETWQPVQSWFDAEMADGLRFGLALCLDGFEDGLENLPGDRLVVREHWAF